MGFAVVTSASGSASKVKPDHFPLPALGTAGGRSDPEHNQKH
jgi:hypothetical protein